MRLRFIYSLTITITLWWMVISAPRPIEITFSPISPVPADTSRHPQVSAEMHFMVQQAAYTHDIPISIAFALVDQESSFNSLAIGSAGEIGLTQLLPATADSQCGLNISDLYRPEMNLDCGFSFLSGLYTWLGTWKMALIAYNRGPQRTINENAHGLPHGTSERYALDILTAAGTI